MKDLIIQKLQNQNVYLESEKSDINKLLIKLKNCTFRQLSKNLRIDESTLRRWRRKGKIPIDLIIQLKSKFPKETRSIIEKISYLSTPKSNQKLKIPDLNEEVGYLLGYVSGDGHLRDPLKHNSQWEITVESWTDKKTLEILKKILKENFEIRSSITKNKTRKGWRLTINCKLLHLILNRVFKIPVGKKADKIKIPKIIQNLPSNILQSYIRGWFDSEGFVTTSKKKLQIEFYVKNRNVLNWMKKQLKIIGINVYQKRKKGTLIIRRSEFDNFNSKIGFWHRKQSSKLAGSRVSGNTRTPSDGHDYWA